MNQPTIVCRIPRAAFDVFSREAIRQVRPLPTIIAGAATAFAQLSPAEREAFTIGEPLSDADRAGLGLKPAGTVKPNRRKSAWRCLCGVLNSYNTSNCPSCGAKKKGGAR